MAANILRLIYNNCLNNVKIKASTEWLKNRVQSIKLYMCMLLVLSLELKKM